MTEQKYNGWTNHQTWAVKLHWDNNEGDYHEMTRQAKIHKGHGASRGAFADYLKDQWEEIFQSVIDGQATEAAKLMVQDVGNGADVDWYEIAHAYYEEVDE